MGHIEELSEIITDKNMATIAIKYLGIEYETVENLRSKNRGDITGFNRDILVKWRNKTQGTAQLRCIIGNDRYLDCKLIFSVHNLVE